MNDQHEWLLSLKAGDAVAIVGKWGTTIKKIDKITPTRQIKIGSSTFKNGYCKGASVWDYGESLVPVTQELITELKRKRISKKLNDFKFDSLTLEQLEAVLKIIEPTESPSEAAAE